MYFTRLALAALSLAVFFTAFFSVGASAQLVSAPVLSPASAPGPDCFTALLNMSDCLTFVEQGSNLTEPDKPCCSELAGLVDSNPICLCQLLGDTGSFGVQIDLSRALKLPDVCQVSTPPASLCSAIGIPVGAPTSSSPSLSPSVAPDTAEALTPSSENNSSAASSLTSFALAGLTGLAVGTFHFLF